eukprot:6055344-Prymnesium_polylepis.1
MDEPRLLSQLARRFWPMMMIHVESVARPAAKRKPRSNRSPGRTRPSPRRILTASPASLPSTPSHPESDVRPGSALPATDMPCIGH